MFLRNTQEPDIGPKPRPLVPALSPEFSRFLYASIGETSDEMPFSVLSALARQNLDPWEEAARLAQMPTDSAVARLTSLIAQLATRTGAPFIPTEVAARLITLLPPPRGSEMPPLQNLSQEARRNLVPIVIYLIVGVLIIASALLGN
jgi:hypothetical protein